MIIPYMYMVRGRVCVIVRADISDGTLRYVVRFPDNTQRVEASANVLLNTRDMVGAA